jgi:hypothetical protein
MVHVGLMVAESHSHMMSASHSLAPLVILFRHLSDVCTLGDEETLLIGFYALSLLWNLFNVAVHTYSRFFRVCQHIIIPLLNYHTCGGLGLNLLFLCFLLQLRLEIVTMFLTRLFMDM